MHSPHHLLRDTDEPRKPQASADPRRWKALAAIAVALFMLILDLTVINVALPDLGAAREAAMLETGIDFGDQVVRAVVGVMAALDEEAQRCDVAAVGNGQLVDGVEVA